MTPDRLRPTLRRRVYEIIESSRESAASAWFDRIIIGLILLNIVAFTLETVPEVNRAWGPWFTAFEIFSVTVFSIEYLLRLWTAVEVPMLSRLSPWQARLRYAKRPMMLIDLVAILPFFLGPLLDVNLTALRMFRLLRFLKLTRYSPAIHTLLRVLAAEQRSLAGALVLLFGALLISSTGMYYIEGSAQPDKFGSVPDAAYWAMTTLTTVGYGDAAPVTALGKLWASITMICGLCILALPVAIIASGFATEVNRHDFVLTWSLMARIPLFAELDADEVARLMPLLHAKKVSPFVEIIADGSPGDAMYFVASGHVRQTAPDGTRDFRIGDFFGVAAMLDDDLNRGSYRAQTRTRLLKLYRDDFMQLEAASPPLAEHVRRVSEARRVHQQIAGNAPAEPPAAAPAGERPA